MTAIGATNTLALADCGSANPHLIKLESWGAKAVQHGAQINMKFRNNAEKDVRMVKAKVLFTDPFGEHIATLSINPDVKCKAGDTFSQSGSYFVDRLANVDPDDITTTVCVEGVVYSDGEVEQFK